MQIRRRDWDLKIGDEGERQLQCVRTPESIPILKNVLVMRDLSFYNRLIDY